MWGIKDQNNPDEIPIKAHVPIYGDIDQIHSSRNEIFRAQASIQNIQFILKKFK